MKAKTYAWWALSCQQAAILVWSQIRMPPAIMALLLLRRNSCFKKLVSSLPAGDSLQNLQNQNRLTRPNKEKHTGIDFFHNFFLLRTERAVDCRLLLTLDSCFQQQLLMRKHDLTQFLSLFLRSKNCCSKKYQKVPRSIGLIHFQNW